jgi:heat shock factor-binding protein 1
MSSKLGSDKLPQDDSSSKELNAFVQNLLKQMQDRFEDMSGNVVSRIDEMGN